MNAAVNKSQGGYSLVELMIGLFVIMTVALGIASIVLTTKRDQLRMTVDSGRMTIVNSLAFSSRNALALKESALKSPYLRDCFCGRPTCIENKVVEVSVWDISGNSLSGINASPKRYDLSGNVCAGADATCVFEVTTTFECKGAKCGKGSFSHGDPMGRVIYKIKFSSAAKTRKEMSYLLDIVGVPVDFSLSSLRLYAPTLCN